MASTATLPSGVTTGCAWPGRGQSVTELMPFMNFLVHWYTCCSDRHASRYWNFITILKFHNLNELRWVSPLRYLKNEWQNGVLLWCTLQAGPPSLHYYCTITLHSCTVLPPVGHSSNHQYHCCQVTRQSSCGSNFYRTFLRFSFDSPSYFILGTTTIKEAVHFLYYQSQATWCIYPFIRQESVHNTPSEKCRGVPHNCVCSVNTATALTEQIKLSRSCYNYYTHYFWSCYNYYTHYFFFQHWHSESTIKIWLYNWDEVKINLV